MVFPPTFDAAFDETFPPDTQAANLLGQDIRNSKRDVRERIALLSGTLANQPINMDAAFGGAGYGVVYFATDTGQMFQWTGAAWIDISQTYLQTAVPQSLDIQGPLAAIPGNGAYQNVYTKLITAGKIPAGKGLRITVASLHSVGTAAAVYKLRIGGVAVEDPLFVPFPYAPSNNINPDRHIWEIFNNVGVQNSQFWTRNSIVNVSVSPAFTPPSIAYGTSLVNFANAVTIVFSSNHPIGDSITPISWLVELIH